MTSPDSPIDPASPDGSPSAGAAATNRVTSNPAARGAARKAARRDLDEVPPRSNMDPVTSEPLAVLAPRGRVPEACLPLLLDATEAAEFVGVSRSSFYRLDLSGVVPSPIRLSKFRRWSRPELRRWVEAGCPPRSRWETAR
jgi:predicted DNA-binding transcriptional regulator AlpA